MDNGHEPALNRRRLRGCLDGLVCVGIPIGNGIGMGANRRSESGQQHSARYDALGFDRFSSHNIPTVDVFLSLLTDSRPSDHSLRIRLGKSAKGMLFIS